MKEYILTGLESYEINEAKMMLAKAEDVSDGYHTMKDLYNHRRALTVAFFNFVHDATIGHVCKSKKHSDGTMFDGYFVVYLTRKDIGQISYHYSLEHWDEFRIPEVEFAPKYDGHTSHDVIERLLKL